MSTSIRPGMGTIPFNDNGVNGVTFRTWAPFAKKIEVIANFTNWNTDPIPLESEGNGNWSKDIYKASLGDEFRYKITTESEEIIYKSDPRGKLINDHTDWNDVIVSDSFDWENDNFITPPWQELVIYELHIASFNRSESSPGNLKTLIEKIDHIVGLGFNAILLLPIFGFKGENSWGYNTAFPFDIESTYGGPNVFKQFVKTAHEKGIAVILDVVYNHFGSDELDKSLRRFDGWKKHNDHDGIYFYPDWRRKTNFGPRPDYGRGEVRSYIKDNLIMWADEYRVDGFRFDSTVNIRNAYGNNGPHGNIAEGWTLMQWLNDEIKKRNSKKITIAEDLQNNEWITEDTDAGGAGFDCQWNAFFFHTIDKNITASGDESRNMFEIKNALEYSHGGDLTRNMIYVNNHDECGAMFDRVKYRLPDRIWLGNAASWYAKKRTTLATSILFTAVGIPLIFQGDEFYSWGSWKDSVEIDWDKKQQFKGIVQLHKDLVTLRRNLNSFTKGLQGNRINVFHNNNTDKVIAFHRWHNGGKGDDVIIVANFGIRSYDNYKIGLPQAGLWKVRFNSDWNGYDNDFGNHFSYDTEAFYEGCDGLPFSGNIGIGPYSVIILSQ